MKQTADPTVEHLEELLAQPEVPEPAKEPEKPKTCVLQIKMTHDPTAYSCGRPGYVLVSLKKPCGHVEDAVICKGHWGEVQADPKGKAWLCREGNKLGKLCGTRFIVNDAVVRWELL